MPKPARVALLVLFVALATAAGSIGGGELARRIGRARGHVGDELVFDALGGGALAAFALAAAAALLLPKRLRLPRWWGAVAALVCLAGLAFVFLGPVPALRPS